MEGFKFLGHMIAVSAMLLAVSIVPAFGQIQSPCTASMISNLTPCMNFMTGSSGNGSSPTGDCCGSLKSLVSDSLDCACLLVTGNVPFQLPINRTFAVSLPRACNMTGVPVQCKASGAPLPAPGPVALGPTSSSTPRAAQSPTPIASAPGPDSTSTTTPAPPAGSETPTTNVPGVREGLTPSAAKRSHVSSTPLLLFAIGVMVLKY